jgi:hypothetical protein
MDVLSASWASQRLGPKVPENVPERRRPADPAFCGVPPGERPYGVEMLKRAVAGAKSVAARLRRLDGAGGRA